MRYLTREDTIYGWWEGSQPPTPKGNSEFAGHLNVTYLSIASVNDPDRVTLNKGECVEVPIKSTCPETKRDNGDQMKWEWQESSEPDGTLHRALVRLGREVILYEKPVSAKFAVDSDPAHRALIASAPDLLEVAKAALRYDAAIAGRAASGEFTDYETVALAHGKDLDALYLDWITKSKDAIEKAKP